MSSPSQLAQHLTVESGDTISLCSIHSGPGLFGIDTRHVREVLGNSAPQPVPLTPNYIDGVVLYRGEVLTTVCLHALLGSQRPSGPRTLLVLEDEQHQERFGLAVDRVGGILTVPSGAIEPNPTALDARSMALFDGTCRTPSGLMVRLCPGSLSPARLAESGLFPSPEPIGQGEKK